MKWSADPTTLKSFDEVLLTVLGLPPSEIDALAMDDYWFWCEVAEREVQRRGERQQQLLDAI
ncbi:hypothetical protein CXB49_21815 [Chromobacterium sp. ATCC 53434]|uniref:hypothetical protein n=1 Tax=Chromobacterium TaxID=535 RepID=UPI000C772558|nr:hypothetical protein [Chromobacterium sp. ATCC 53434]AUH53234.1 hypothetical protein CXB49_21815 [Chromobacterium sp. ATCC 53434]